jgi:hypothetical protein
VFHFILLHSYFVLCKPWDNWKVVGRWHQLFRLCESFFCCFELHPFSLLKTGYALFFKAPKMSKIQLEATTSRIDFYTSGTGPPTGKCQKSYLPAKASLGKKIDAQNRKTSVHHTACAPLHVLLFPSFYTPPHTTAPHHMCWSVGILYTVSLYVGLLVPSRRKLFSHSPPGGWCFN